MATVMSCQRDARHGEIDHLRDKNIVAQISEIEPMRRWRRVRDHPSYR